jgi:protein SCO1/2
MVDAKGGHRSLADVLGGHPGVLIFADYTCRTLCGPILAMTAAGLSKTGLTPGKDFRLIVMGLDPKDTAANAVTMKHAQVGEGALAQASTFLLPSDAAVRQVTHAFGYQYAYDTDTDQYAHPAVVFVVARDGRLTRMLSGLGVGATDLRLALVEAGNGRVGGLADHLRLLCYGYDPVAGAYTLTIRRWLSMAAFATVIVLAGGIGFLSISRRPAADAGRSPSGPSGRA